jgi:hypothetical protein
MHAHAHAHAGVRTQDPEPHGRPLRRGHQLELPGELAGHPEPGALGVSGPRREEAREGIVDSGPVIGDLADEAVAGVTNLDAQRPTAVALCVGKHLYCRDDHVPASSSDTVPAESSALRASRKPLGPPSSGSAPSRRAGGAGVGTWDRTASSGSW